MELYFSSALEVLLICVCSTEQLYYHIIIIYHIYLNIVSLFYLASIVCHFTDIYAAAKQHTDHCHSKSAVNRGPWNVVHCLAVRSRFLIILLVVHMQIVCM